MAKWNQQAFQDFNNGVAATGMNRADAKRFETHIDTWAGAVGAFQSRFFNPPAGQGSFEVQAQNAEVIRVTYE
jgi:hypothetical protein